MARVPETSSPGKTAKSSKGLASREEASRNDISGGSRGGYWVSAANKKYSARMSDAKDKKSGMEFIARVVFQPGLGKFVAKSVAAAIEGTEVSVNPVDLSKYWSGHFTADEIADLIVPKRTLARRVARQEPLNLDEADRAIRVGHVSVEADRVFGNAEKAFRWLRRPNQTLNDQRPIDLLTSHAGVQVVLERLGQIDHGMFV